MRRAYGTLQSLMPAYNGLKSVVTKWCEPTALCNCGRKRIKGNPQRNLTTALCRRSIHLYNVLKALSMIGPTPLLMRTNANAKNDKELFADGKDSCFKLETCPRGIAPTHLEASDLIRRTIARKKLSAVGTAHSNIKRVTSFFQAMPLNHKLIIAPVISFYELISRFKICNTHIFSIPQ